LNETKEVPEKCKHITIMKLRMRSIMQSSEGHPRGRAFGDMEKCVSLQSHQVDMCPHTQALEDDVVILNL